MAYWQFSDPRQLLTTEYTPLPLIFLFDSISGLTPLTIILTDRSHFLPCELTHSAQLQVLNHTITPGDIVTLSHFSLLSDHITIRAFEKVAKYSYEFLTISEIAQRPGNDYVNLQGRVVAVSPTHYFQTKFGQKPIFNLALVDIAGNEIIVSFFRNEAVKFEGFCSVGNGYDFTKFRIDANSLKSTSKYRFSLTADENSSIRGNYVYFPQASFSVTAFNSLSEVKPDSLVDIAGVVTVIGEKDGNRRIVKLVNHRNEKMEVILWGELAEQECEQYRGRQSIVVVKRVQVKDAHHLSALPGISELVFDPVGLRDISPLRQWKQTLPSEPEAYIPMQSTGESRVKSAVPHSLTPSQVHTIPQILQLAQEEGWDRKYSLEAAIHEITCRPLETAVMYPACAGTGCLKAVCKDGSGKYVCRKCGLESEFCTYRYRLKMILTDESSNMVKVTLFDQKVKELLKVSAVDLKKCDEQTTYSRFEDLIGRIYLWTLTRNKRNLHDSQSYIVEGMKDTRRECGID